MWPNQGPPPMIPGYNPAYPSVPPAGVYPQGPYPGYPAGQYPAMGPVAPGVMPVPVVTPGAPCVIIEEGHHHHGHHHHGHHHHGHHHHHHHGGLFHMADALAGRMGLFEHKVHKKMKKAHKHGHYKHCKGSSGSSDSD